MREGRHHGEVPKELIHESEFYDGHHRFEHWYRDNTLYFITSRTRDGFPAFESEGAKGIFWDRFDHYTKLHGFTPCVTSLLNNHYHTVGHLKMGEELGEMMRKIHGSVAWMVMKEIGVTRVPFWRSKGNKDHFDGCLRDVLQGRRAYRYTLLQAVRAKLVPDWREYPHTRVNVEMKSMIRRAVELKAFLEDVPYARYERKHGHQR
jgi:hypothetical protein